VENGGSGGAVAAPLVRQVMEAYFRSKGRENKVPFFGPTTEDYTSGIGELLHDL